MLFIWGCFRLGSQFWVEGLCHLNRENIYSDFYTVLTAHFRCLMPPRGQIEKANISNTRYCIGTVRYLSPQRETAVKSICNTNRGKRFYRDSDRHWSLLESEGMRFWIGYKDVFEIDSVINTNGQFILWAEIERCILDVLSNYTQLMLPLMWYRWICFSLGL